MGNQRKRKGRKRKLSTELETPKWKRWGKRILTIGIIAIVVFTLFNLFTTGSEAGHYNYCVAQINKAGVLQDLRDWATKNNDPIDGLNFTELLKWEHRHLVYWGGELQARPESPVSILTINQAKIYHDKSGATYWAVYCLSYNSLQVIAPQGTNFEFDYLQDLGFTLGRCGEFSLLYYSLVTANGYIARVVLDCSILTNSSKNTAGDHAWVELKSTDGSWLHCDPTEAIVNHPDMYRDEWNKDVNRVYAVNGIETVDVTSTYA